YLAKISDDVVGEEVEGISTSQATTGNLFRYDSTDNLYIFNLSTNGLTSGTWQVRIDLDDGTSKYVNFGLK
ncbi:MAG: PxKF domain-containing protein, partial [Candidatus Omnitrophica bacterium]|nr:PxKF domain-containing protein [Candidatus Omnitrophota bacterium]